MKILFIITQADGGGAQKYVLDLAKHFGGKVAAGTEADRLFTDAQKAGIETIQLKYLKRNISPIFDWLALNEIIKLIKKEQPDIVHLNSSKAGFLGSLAAIFCGSKKPKIIFTAHGFIYNEPLSPFAKKVYLLAERFASQYRDFIIAVSEADRKSAIENKVISADKISVIHNGIDEIIFLPRQEAREKLKLGQSEFIFGTVANFYKTKGLNVLIQAVSYINKDWLENVRFVLIGIGPEKENLELRIKNLELKNTITLLGKVDDAAKYLKTFDVFILPSRKEGFPYTLLEAMQAGLPIVATNVGGNSEALGDAGVVLEPDNPKIFASFIASLLLSIKQGNKNFLNLSERALERSKQFSKEKMLKETEEVYRKLITRLH